MFYKGGFIMNEKYYKMVDLLIVPDTITLDDFFSNLNKMYDPLRECIGVKKFHFRQYELLKGLYRDGFVLDHVKDLGVTEAGKLIGLDYVQIVNGKSKYMTTTLNEDAQRYILNNYPFELFYKRNHIYLKGAANYLGKGITEKNISDWLSYKRYTMTYNHRSGGTFKVVTRLGETIGVRSNVDEHGFYLFDTSSCTLDSIILWNSAVKFLEDHIIEILDFIDHQDEKILS